MDVSWPKKWSDLTMSVIDVETTGFDEKKDRVIEVGIIRFEKGEVTESYGQLVNPRRPIPKEVVELTGITDDDVKDAPTFDEIAAEVHKRLVGVGIVAYNLGFDRKFVAEELKRCGLSWPSDSPTFDPLIFARQFFKDSPKKNLATIAGKLDLTLEEAHRAVHDAEVTGRILYAFKDRLPSDLDQLLTLQSQWQSAQQAEMAHWKNFDTSMTSLHESPIGLGPAYIYGDEADPLRALYKSVPEAKSRKK